MSALLPPLAVQTLVNRDSLFPSHNGQAGIQGLPSNNQIDGALGAITNE